jgi:DNA-directed RNA polymerase specialized sigma subunit
MENLNLLRKIAWSFHHSTGLEWDDLFQEAYLAYRYALEHYDPDKDIKISAFIWIHVSNQLRTYYQKEQDFVNPLRRAYRRDKKAFINLDAWIPSDEVHNNNFFVFESLTSDAQKIAEIVLCTTKKYLKLSSDQAQQKVTNILLNRGWSQERIHNGLHDLVVACS